MKEKIKQLVDQYLRQTTKRKVHHIDVAVPGHDGRFWVIDVSLITAEADFPGVQLAIYFSVNPHSRRGRRIVEVIDLLDPFEAYQKAIDGRHTVYYLVTNNSSATISKEIESKIQALFPTLDHTQVKLSLEWMDDWTAND